MLAREQQSAKERLKENEEKVKMNKQLPYLVGNIGECECRSDLGSAHVLCTWCECVTAWYYFFLVFPIDMLCCMVVRDDLAETCLDSNTCFSCCWLFACS